MNLQGRNLSENMRGADVALLHRDLETLGHAIPLREVQDRLFGAATKSELERFQSEHELPSTGIVDERTAARLRLEVEAATTGPQRFAVRGRISQNGKSLSGVIVRAFDRHFRVEQSIELGKATTNEQGLYEIVYTSQQFSNSVKRRADVFIRAFNSAGAEVGSSETYFRAPAEVVIDILVVSPRDMTITEVENLVGIVNPLVGDTALADLTDDGIDFLVSETRRERQHIELLRQSSQRARETGLAMEVFFGLGWQKFPIGHLEQLLTYPLQTLRQGLEIAARDRIIPVVSRESLDATIQALEQLRNRTTVPGTYEFFVRLLDSETRAPLAGHIIRPFALHEGVADKELGHDMTNSQGLAAFAYTAPRPISGQDGAHVSTQNIQVRVFTSEGKEIHQQDIRTSTVQDRVMDILVPPQVLPSKATPSIKELNTTLGLNVPTELLTFLNERHIDSLADIRRSGGLRRLQGLPVPSNHAAVAALEAHAFLNWLTPEADVTFNAHLIQQGFTSLASIANATRSRFVNAAHEKLGDFKAAEMHVKAGAAKNFLDHKVTEMKTAAANGFGLIEPDIQKGEPLLGVLYCCEDCDSALSPLAYLADLIEYALAHLTNDEQPIALAFLETHFHQRFGQLPASCEEMDKKIRQVRICVEVLRGHVGASPLSLAQQNSLKKKEQEYRLSAYTTLLTKIGTSYEEIGRARTGGVNFRKALADRLGIDLLPAKPDQLDALYLNPEATPPALTEAALEELFGLVDTTRDPLTPGKTPLFQTWQLDHLRTIWKAEDWPVDLLADKPIIDPDVIDSGYLRNPSAGQAPFDLLQSRRNFVDDKLAQLRAAREANGLNHILEQVLGKPLVDLDQLKQNLAKGLNIESTIDTIQNDLHLSVDSFHRLMEIRAKDGVPVVANRPTDAEWDEMYAILTQAEKVKKFPEWRAEEAGVLLGPKQFWVAAQQPKLRAWLAFEETRSEWLEALRLRSGAPNIDPDVVGPADLKQLFLDPAFPVWNFRRNWVYVKLAAYEAAPRTTIGLSDIVQTSLGITLADFDVLDAERSTGEDIDPRLAQLCLDFDAFLRLFEIRELVSSGASVLDAEWKDLSSILANVQKRMQFAEWRKEEEAQDLILGPDRFKLQKVTTPTFPSKPSELPAWLATEEARRRWEDLLGARIEQEQTLIKGLEEAVDSTEEATLSILRDGLIQVSNSSGTTLEDRAKWVTDNLLIDASEGSCQKVTRISQAIETLQGLLFSVRTAQLNDTYPLLDLDADYFDEEWKYIGSFSNWRAAMGIFLHPENLLQPSLRKSQTPIFHNLVVDLRFKQRLSTPEACAAAKQYSDYFRDVCSLSVQATCQALTRLRTGNSCIDEAASGYRHLVHLFGIGGETGTVYWSTYDPQDGTGYAQTFWDPVPGFGKAISIVGSVPYRPFPDQRYIFLFVLIESNGDLELVFTRYDLEECRWSGELTPLSLPPETGKLNAIAVQRITDDMPPELAVLVNSGLYRRSLNQAATYWENPSSPSSDADASSGVDVDWQGFKVDWESQHPNSSPILSLHNVLANPDWGEFNLYSSYEGKLHVTLFFGGDQDLGEATPIGAANLHDTVHVFYKVNGQSVDEWFGGGGGTQPGVVGLHDVARNFGEDPTGNTVIAYGRTSPQPGVYCSDLKDSAIDLSSQLRIAPNVSGPFDIPNKLSESKLQSRRESIKQAFQNNEDVPASTLTYLEEAYYFVPVHLGLLLQKGGEYTAALDFFRTVYDYSMPIKQREIYYGLLLDQKKSSKDAYKRETDWLLDPLNPHNLGAARRNAYTQFTLLCIVHCCLEFADAEFTRDTAESVPRARTLYLTALDLMNAAPLKQGTSTCEEAIGNLNIQVEDAHWAPLIEQTKMELSSMFDLSIINSTVSSINAAFSTDSSPEIKFRQAFGLIANAKAQQAGHPSFEAVLAERSDGFAKVHTALLASETIAESTQNIAGEVARDFLRNVSLISGVRSSTLQQEHVSLPWLREKIATGTNGNAESQNLLSGKWQDYSPFLTFNLIAPTRMAGLAHIATGSPMQSLKVVGVMFGHYVPAAIFRFCIPPNPVLKSLRLHAEANLYKLRNCRNIAGLQRQLEPYAVATTEHIVPAGDYDGGQNALSNSTFQQPTQYRYWVLIDRAKQLVQLAAQTEAAMLSALVNAIEKKDAQNYSLLKAQQDMELAWANVGTQDLRVQEAQAGVQVTDAQRQRVQADVDYYQGLLDKYDDGSGLPDKQVLVNAKKDLAVADQQHQSSAQGVVVQQQQRSVLALEAQHATAVVDFLANHYTTAELYDWMSGILGSVYGFFLQQATAMARLAADQLAFERQEVIPTVIQTDYWEISSDGDTASTPDGQGTNRRGLTGSARLLQDINGLDLYAFQTKSRKQHITKTISLARLSPIEFERFRESGIMTFLTPMEMFYRDFPEHILRLIERVGVSVIALTPPGEGIRATLSTTGISRVVVGKDVFQTVIINSGPQSIAVSSPLGAAPGAVELVQESEMLVPFEGMGVDATWEFRMLKPANLWDYSTIADVLINIEYSALASFAYRQQMIQQLNEDLTIRLERPFSFRHQFADQWYDLHNPEQTATPMSVRFATRSEDFPQNLQDLKIQQVTLYFSSSTSKAFESPLAVQLYFREDNSGIRVGGSGTPISGLISTGQGSAPSWISMIGRRPMGEWELTLPDTEDARDLVKTKIADILLNITFAGSTPQWPA